MFLAIIRFPWRSWSEEGLSMPELVRYTQHDTPSFRGRCCVDLGRVTVICDFECFGLPRVSMLLTS